MKYLGKFERYEPPVRAAGGIANHLRNGDGVDWYDHSWDRQFTESHIFIGVDDSGTIVTATNEGHLMFPVGLNVYAFDSSDDLYKEDVEELYHGTFKDGIYTHRSEVEEYYKRHNEEDKNYSLKKLRESLSIYSTALTLGVISDEDKKKLEELTKLYKEVQSLDICDKNMKVPELNL